MPLCFFQEPCEETRASMQQHQVGEPRHFFCTVKKWVTKNFPGFLFFWGKNIWMFPKIVGFPPKSSILIGFSIIFTIHFGAPLFLETSISTRQTLGIITGLVLILMSSHEQPGGQHFPDPKMVRAKGRNKVRVEHQADKHHPTKNAVFVFDGPSFSVKTVDFEAEKLFWTTMKKKEPLMHGISGIYKRIVKSRQQAPTNPWLMLVKSLSQMTSLSSLGEIWPGKVLCSSTRWCLCMVLWSKTSIKWILP